MNINLDDHVIKKNSFLDKYGCFIAGGLSGIVSRTCIAPFDRLKVFLIAKKDDNLYLINHKNCYNTQNTGSNEKTKKQHHKVQNSFISRKINSSCLINSLKMIWMQEGIKSFYVGNGLNILKVIPEFAIKFGFFELIKNEITENSYINGKSFSPGLLMFFSGGLVGVFSQMIVYPLDTLRYRIQCYNRNIEKKSSLIIFQATKNILKKEGILTFYRGFFTGLLGVFPYAALDLGTFYTIKKYLIEKNNNNMVSSYVILGLGALSGAISSSIVYPLNLLRTRLQIQNTFAHPYLYTGLCDVFRSTINKEGLCGLFKGLSPSLLKVIPSVSITYFIYENLKLLFNLNENAVK